MIGNKFDLQNWHQFRRNGGWIRFFEQKKGLSDSDTKSIKEIFDQTFNCNVWS